MRLPIDALAQALKLGASAKKDSDTPVRVAVYVDSSASPFVIETVRDALVPQTTSALVRVERLGGAPIEVRADTDVVLVLSCGSERLQPAVQEMLVAGAPVAVVAESSIEVPFITADTPMLGLIAATDASYLLETLARWILDRTEKDVAFAANFPFMRIAAANRIITSCALTNMATGALFFIPGADFPVMTIAEVGMVLKLAAVFGYKLEPERGYEVAAVVGSGLLLRLAAKGLCRLTPRLSFFVKALVAAGGTYAMGRALASAYERGIDYAPVNARVSRVVSFARNVTASGSAGPAGVQEAAVNRSAR